jgi:hypothetical protein
MNTQEPTNSLLIDSFTLEAAGKQKSYLQAPIEVELGIVRKHRLQHI